MDQSELKAMLIHTLSTLSKINTDYDDMTVNNTKKAVHMKGFPEEALSYEGEVDNVYDIEEDEMEVETYFQKVFTKGLRLSLEKCIEKGISEETLRDYIEELKEAKSNIDHSGYSDGSCCQKEYCISTRIKAVKWVLKEYPEGG